jgi:hypothetical protein
MSRIHAYARRVREPGRPPCYNASLPFATAAVLLIPTLLLLTVPGPASAQAPDTVTVSGEPVCGECRIVLEHWLDIGDRDGPGAVNPQAFIRMDERGRFLVSAPANRGVIQAFDSAGHYIASFGRDGQGPGEYIRPQIVWEAGDTLFISDVAQRRVTRVDRGFNVLSTTTVSTLI